MIILLLSIIVIIISIEYFKSSNIWLKCNAKGWFYTISENLTVNGSFSCASSIILYEFSIYPPNQELLCRGWFLPPNTYDCGSFVVNGTAVVGKEQNNPYNCWKSTQKEEIEQQLEGTMHEKPFLIMLLSAKQETSQLLGDDAENRQARQMIMRRRSTEQLKRSHLKTDRCKIER